MTKLRPNIKLPNNSHILRDSRRAQKQLLRLTELLDASLSPSSVSCEVEEVLKLNGKKRRKIKVIIGVDIL